MLKIVSFTNINKHFPFFFTTFRYLHVCYYISCVRYSIYKNIFVCSFVLCRFVA